LTYLALDKVLTALVDVTSSYILCHIIIHTMSHHQTYLALDKVLTALVDVGLDHAPGVGFRFRV